MRCFLRGGATHVQEQGKEWLRRDITAAREQHEKGQGESTAENFCSTCGDPYYPNPENLLGLLLLWVFIHP